MGVAVLSVGRLPRGHCWKYERGCDVRFPLKLKTCSLNIVVLYLHVGWTFSQKTYLNFYWAGSEHMCLPLFATLGHWISEYSMCVAYELHNITACICYMRRFACGCGFRFECTTTRDVDVKVCTYNCNVINDNNKRKATIQYPL